MNLRSFSLYSDYSHTHTLSTVGESSWSWISIDHIQAQKEKSNFVVACLRPPSNAKLGIFPLSRSCKNEKEMYKKVWCTWEVVVCLLNLLFFFKFSLLSASLDLKVPIVRWPSVIFSPALWGYFATNIFKINELKAEWHFNNQLAGVALPCQQRLHFRCVSWRAKSFAWWLTRQKCSLCSQG